MTVVLRFPNRSIWAAPMKPTSTWPGCMRSPKTSVSPPSITLPGTRHASPIDRGVRFGRASTTPDSKTMMQFGAWVAFASIPPSMGSPVPMNAISPSRISRAAQIAMSSVRLYPDSADGGGGGASIAIVHLPAHRPLRAEFRESPLAELPKVCVVTFEAEDPFVGPSLPALEGHAPLRVLPPKRNVDVVVALDLVRVRAERDEDDPVHAEARDDRAVRVLPNDLGRHDLLDREEDLLPRHGPPYVVPELAPDLGVPVRVAPLRMEHAHVRVAGGDEGDPLLRAERVL